MVLSYYTPLSALASSSSTVMARAARGYCRERARQPGALSMSINLAARMEETARTQRGVRDLGLCHRGARQP